MSGSEVAIDLGRIERHGRTLAGCGAAAGIGIFDVTKAACGKPQLARAMLRGGRVVGIAV